MKLQALVVNNTFGSLYAVRPVGGICQLEVEQEELFRKADHIRILFLILVEDETSFTVERLQVGFYAGGFFRFLLFIGTDIDPFAFFFLLCFKKGTENLLEERVLE